nr:MAG TPA: hypothetical protein [Caudoviricetes sp.]
MYLFVKHYVKVNLHFKILIVRQSAKFPNGLMRNMYHTLENCFEPC